MPFASIPTRLSADSRSFIVLLCIVGLGFLIRIAGIDWDGGTYMHPDERHIVMDVVVDRIDFSERPSLSWLDPANSPINPRPTADDGVVMDFAYGTFPVYMVDVIGELATHLTGESWNGYERSQYLGRGLSTLLDTATIVVVFLIATALAGRGAGIFGAMIYAFLPIAIQLSHFFTVDACLTFFLLAGVYTCMNAGESGRVRDFAIGGVWFGLAMATKSSALPFAGIIGLASLLAALRDVRVGFDIPATMSKLGGRLSAAFIASVVVFFLGEPFAFIQPDRYLDSFRVQNLIQSGRVDVPFTAQYVNTTPFSYQLEQAVRFGMGPVAVLIGIVGAGVIAWLAVRHRSAPAIVLGAWMVGYLAVVLYPETKFLRYLAPLAPAVTVTAGIAIASVVNSLRARRKQVMAIGFAITILLASTAHGAAFSSVTIDEPGRVKASVWLYEHLPPGSTVSSEIWDDSIPLQLSAGWSGETRRIDGAGINLYLDGPTQGDIARLAPVLSHLPGGLDLSAAIGAGNVDEVILDLRSLTEIELSAMSAMDSARFRSSLTIAAAGMTTSPELGNSINSLSREIRQEGSVHAEHLDRLAESIEQSLDSSTLHQIHDHLDSVDYYVLASNRVQSGIAQNPWRYPVSNRMYELLESETLGFDLAAEFTSEPSLFGWSYPDQDGDESYLNYDHPAVTVYEKSDLVPFDRFVQLIGSAAMAQSQPTRTPETGPLTFDEPVSDLPVVDDARWSELVTGNSWGATLTWIIMLVLLQAAALPVTRTVFRNFPDKGWGYTRMVAIIVPATVIWWLASVDVLLFDARWVVASLALFALAAWLWLPRTLWSDLRNRPTRRLFIAVEIVFWLTFGLFLLYRMINPDSWEPIWGGEKPMEFAHINAILRSSTFPPVDPWYAQGFINYYYYSFYLVAFLIKLTGIPVEFAFNLAQPTVMAVLASGVFSIGAMIGNGISRGRQSGVLSGVIAVLLVSFAGNMVSVAQIVSRLRSESFNIDAFSYWVWAPSRAIVDTEEELTPAFRDPNGYDGQLITEFPYFTGLYSDLHAHVIGMPLLVLCMGLAASFAVGTIRHESLLSRSSVARIVVAGITLGIVYPTNAWDLPVNMGLVIGGIIIGSATIISVSHRWTYALSAIGAIGLIALTVSLPFLWHFKALFGSIDTVPATTSLLELESHVGGLLLVATASVPGIIGLLSSRRRQAPSSLLVGSLGVVLLLRWFVAEQWPDLVTWTDLIAVVIVSAIWLGAFLSIRGTQNTFDFGLPGSTNLVVTAIGVGMIVSLLLLGNQVAAVYLAIAVAAIGVWLTRRAPAIRFVALLMAGAALIGAGVEFVYLVDDLSGGPWTRMNSVFKFYNQIWILLGVAGSACAGVLMMNLLGRLAKPTRHRVTSGGNGVVDSPRRSVFDWELVATISTVLILTLGAAYPIVATAERLSTRFEPRDGGLTLNAYAWMDFGTVQLSDGTVVSFDEDRDVIDWFNHEVPGTPVIAEASFGPYRCNGSRISIGTGLPSVLGWQRHQQQQRPLEVLPQREADLRTLYGSADIDTKLGIIYEYDIHYIVVGELERNYPVLNGNACTPMDQTTTYDHFDLVEGLATFEDMEGPTLEVAFQSGSTVVYRVVGNS